MLYIESNGTIRLTRGDTARLTVNITNQSTNDSYNIEDGDTLSLSVKKTVKDDRSIMQKVITGSDTFHIEPSDTSSLAFGKYKYRRCFCYSHFNRI